MQIVDGLVALGVAVRMGG